MNTFGWQNWAWRPAQGGAGIPASAPEIELLWLDGGTAYELVDDDGDYLIWMDV